MPKAVSLLVGTRKGAFVLSSDKEREKWSISPAMFLGHIIYHIVSDPRNPQNVVMAAKTGHLGPTVYFSNDAGITWTESKLPPAFPKVAEGEKGRAVDSVFWISAGHESEKDVWYAGTAPAGVFRSEDVGNTWKPVAGFNEHPSYADWTANGPTPAGSIVHSILIDPRDANHMYIGISVGGIFETKDKGKSWTPLNRGIEAEFMPDPTVDYGHDPHCVILHPMNPDRLYHQNHCGIYRLDRPSNEWVRIGNNMPKEIGDIGFPIVAHPKKVDTVWVFPMDGSTVWPRTSPDAKPAVYVTKDGGRKWIRQDKGMPRKNAYFTVKRQAMTCDNRKPLGLYYGTSQGEIWGTADEGESWKCLVKHLPEIYSVTVLN